MRRLFRIVLFLGLIAGARAAVWADEGGIRLASVDYEIMGVSNRSAVASYVGLEIGKVFPDEAALEAYIESARRRIFNNRVFDPASTVEYTIEAAADGQREARATVKIVDSVSSVIVPLPKYSSSYGFCLAVRFKDYNFLGSLDLISLSLDYYSRSGEVDVGANGNIPFWLFGGKWEFYVDMDLSIPKDSDIVNDTYVRLMGMYPWQGKNLSWFVQPTVSFDSDPDEDTVTGAAGAALGVKYKLGLPWTLSTSASFVLKNDTNVLSEYLSNGLTLSTAIPLLKLGSLGSLTFTPSTTVYVNTNFPTPAVDETGWTSSASLSVGQVNWFGNFRKGASFSAKGTYTKRFIYDDATDAWDGFVSVDASAFAVWKNLIGLNTRIVGRWYPDWTYLNDSNTDYDWDDDFRGRPGVFYGDIGAVLNIEIPVNMAQGRFFGADFLEAEVFFTPFLDIGFVRTDPDHEFSLEEYGLADCGFEFTVFPTKARSFAYRLSLGYDLLDFIETKDFQASKLEIFLGLGTLF